MFTNPKTNKSFAAAHLPYIEPTVTHITEHPLFTTQLKGYSYNQILDKTFENKACTGMLLEEKSCYKPSCTKQPHLTKWLVNLY
jgi:hypothetical protein